MIEGFYNVVFQTPLGMGGGVVYLRDGKVHGGDSTMYYLGSYQVAGEALTASLKIATHLKLPGIASVFGVPSATLTLSGKISGDSIVGTATAAQVPGIKMGLTLTRITG